MNILKRRNYKNLLVLGLQLMLTTKPLFAHAYDLESEDTFGVETVEAPTMQFYISPKLATSALLGNGTMDYSSHAGFALSGGLLVSQQLLLELSYERGEQGLSQPIFGAPGITLGGDPNEVFSYQQNKIDVLAKLFVFGRDSRFRPFIAGGFGYTSNTLNYSKNVLAATGNQAYYSKDFLLKQVVGQGEVGIEMALTSLIVLNAQFGIQGVLSYSGSSGDADMATKFDQNKLSIANALSKMASYTMSVGMGLYF